jgi:hypothetical protein
MRPACMLPLRPPGSKRGELIEQAIQTAERQSCSGRLRRCLSALRTDESRWVRRSSCRRVDVEQGRNVMPRVPQESRGDQLLRGSRLCAVALVAAISLLLMPAGASAASPVLEFVTPGHGLPVDFTTESGEVKAEMAGFEPLVHCTASHGEGEITGPRSTVSKYRLTGCTAGVSQKCKSADATNEEEIKTGPIDAELVYIDQGRREVGMLLNPGGGTYIAFECGGESAEGQGPFLAPVSPINQEATAFTATLSQLDSVQTPDEYENENGELLQAIPTGKRGSNAFVPTGVELAMAVHTSVPVEVKAVTAQEVEAKKLEEEVKQLQASLKTQEEALKKAEERAGQAGAEAKKLGEEVKQLQASLKTQEEALKKAEERARRAGAEAKAAKQRQAELEKTKSSTRGRLLTRALRECQKQPKKRRARCIASANKKYGGKTK